MSRVSPVRIRIAVVQPGLSKQDASPAQLELLAVTENYLLETYNIPFGVMGSSSDPDDRTPLFRSNPTDEVLLPPLDNRPLPSL